MVDRIIFISYVTILSTVSLIISDLIFFKKIIPSLNKTLFPWLLHSILDFDRCFKLHYMQLESQLCIVSTGSNSPRR